MSGEVRSGKTTTGDISIPHLLTSGGSWTSAVSSLPLPPDDSTIRLVELSQADQRYKNVEELVRHAVHGTLAQTLGWSLDGLCCVETALATDH